jgi:hypothetical protein
MSLPFVVTFPREISGLRIEFLHSEDIPTAANSASTSPDTSRSITPMPHEFSYDCEDCEFTRLSAIEPQLLSSRQRSRLKQTHSATQTSITLIENDNLEKDLVIQHAALRSLLLCPQWIQSLRLISASFSKNEFPDSLYKQVFYLFIYHPFFQASDFRHDLYSLGPGSCDATLRSLKSFGLNSFHLSKIISYGPAIICVLSMDNLLFSFRKSSTTTAYFKCPVTFLFSLYSWLHPQQSNCPSFQLCDASASPDFLDTMLHDLSLCVTTSAVRLPSVHTDIICDPTRIRDLYCNDLHGPSVIHAFSLLKTVFDPAGIYIGLDHTLHTWSIFNGTCLLVPLLIRNGRHEYYFKLRLNPDYLWSQSPLLNTFHHHSDGISSLHPRLATDLQSSLFDQICATFTECQCASVREYGHVSSGPLVFIIRFRSNQGSTTQHSTILEGVISFHFHYDTLPRYSSDHSSEQFGTSKSLKGYHYGNIPLSAYENETLPSGAYHFLNLVSQYTSLNKTHSYDTYCKTEQVIPAK